MTHLKDSSPTKERTSFEALLNDPLLVGDENEAPPRSIDYDTVASRLSWEAQIALGLVAGGVLIERAFGFAVATPVYALAMCIEGWAVLDMAKAIRTRWFT